VAAAAENDQPRPAAAQFLKLGAAGALPGLSEHFLIWDLDMVPLLPLRLFWPPPPGAPAGAPVQVGTACRNVPVPVVGR